MKKILLLICLVTLTNSCNFKIKEFTLIGKWKEIESIDSNGAEKIHTEIENGKEIIFEKGNIVIDHLNNKGKYEISGKKLHLIFPKEEFFYFFHQDENDSEKISLSPVTADYKIICDEGCSTIYQKLK